MGTHTPRGTLKYYRGYVGYFSGKISVMHIPKIIISLNCVQLIKKMQFQCNYNAISVIAWWRILNIWNAVFKCLSGTRLLSSISDKLFLQKCFALVRGYLAEKIFQMRYIIKKMFENHWTRQTRRTYPFAYLSLSYTLLHSVFILFPRLGTPPRFSSALWSQGSLAWRRGRTSTRKRTGLLCLTLQHCSTSSSLLSCASVQNEMLTFEWESQVSGYQSCMCKDSPKVAVISAKKVLSNTQIRQFHYKR